MVVPLEDKAAYQSFITENPKAVVDFMASWCQPCNKIAPQYLELAEKYQDFKFSKVDVDDNSDAAEEADADSLPTMIVFVGGKEVGRVVGADIPKLEALLNEHK